MAINDTDKKTSFWWILALGLLLYYLISGYPSRPGEHSTPQNVHTIPAPKESTSGK